MNTALTVKLPAGPIANTGELRTYLESVREFANILTPVAVIDFIPPMTRVSIRPVMLDTVIREVTYKKAGGGTGTAYQGTDVYRDVKFCQPDEVAISKVGLMKLFNAAAISIADSYRMDSGADPNYCNWRVIVDVPQPDGKIQRLIANKVIDLRMENKATARLSDGDLSQQRARITELAESKALTRVARNALNLAQKYQVKDLLKPFLIPVLVPDLDITDPEIKKMVAAKQLGIVDAVYANRAILPPARGDGGLQVGPGGEVIETTIVGGDDDDIDQGDDIAPLPRVVEPTPAPAPQPTRFVCACPCGCKNEISKAVHDATKREGGSPRCRECWPTKFYDTARHAALADLGTTPLLTPAEAEKIAATKR